MELKKEPEQIFLLDRFRNTTKWWPYRTYKTSLRNDVIRFGPLKGQKMFIEVEPGYEVQSTIDPVNPAAAETETKKKGDARPVGDVKEIPGETKEDFFKRAEQVAKARKAQQNQNRK